MKFYSALSIIALSLLASTSSSAALMGNWNGDLTWQANDDSNEALEGCIIGVQQTANHLIITDGFECTYTPDYTTVFDIADGELSYQGMKVGTLNENGFTVDAGNGSDRWLFEATISGKGQLLIHEMLVDHSYTDHTLGLIAAVSRENKKASPQSRKKDKNRSRRILRHGK